MYNFNRGVTAELERLKWEADIREKEMDKYISALLSIRKLVKNTPTSAPLYLIHEILESVQI